MILAVDQGTTGTTCLVVGDGLEVLGRATTPVAVAAPRPGRVEQDPEELWRSVETTAAAALADAGAAAREIEAIGIANQRETTIVWERSSGAPVAPAIVWQDRRTAERCRGLPAGLLRARTGLTADPYFSATKLEWLLRERGGGSAGLAFGTVDAWLLWRLTDGAVHATDVTNASRTLLLDLARLDWDDELLALFSVPRELLPEVRRSAEIVAEGRLGEVRAPVAALAGDQQASLYGHGCLAAGETKATFGTGAFLLAASGGDCSEPPHGLVRTAGALPAGAAPRYALEGSIFAAGAALRWLRDGLGLLGDVRESEALARSVPSSGGVHFVPALAGLGSPHWAPEARGLIAGLTQTTRRPHLVRAALEAVAFQTRDVLDALPRRPPALRVDGGATANGFLVQFLADVCGVPVEVAAERETTALGAAGLAGVATGRWREDELPALLRPATRVEPARSAAEVEALVDAWRAAVRLTLRAAAQE
ncbi:MAG TPA: glycerol kinase GlpK [Gaiellaceae bacterium]|nr:glycerol kinase GlpK [Gaiellaceae bacterium]